MFPFHRTKRIRTCQGIAHIIKILNLFFFLSQLLFHNCYKKIIPVVISIACILTTDGLWIILGLCIYERQVQSCTRHDDKVFLLLSYPTKVHRIFTALTLALKLGLCFLSETKPIQIKQKISILSLVAYQATWVRSVIPASCNNLSSKSWFYT